MKLHTCKTKNKIASDQNYCQLDKSSIGLLLKATDWSKDNRKFKHSIASYIFDKN